VSDQVCTNNAFETKALGSEQAAAVGTNALDGLHLPIVGTEVEAKNSLDASLECGCAFTTFFDAVISAVSCASWGLRKPFADFLLSASLTSSVSLGCRWETSERVRANVP